MRTCSSGRRPPLVRFVVVIAAAALLGACSDDSGDDSNNRSPDPPVPGVEQVSPTAAEQLCEMILVDIDTWRQHGPTVGRITFEGYVRSWAAEYEQFDAAIIRDRSFVDSVTIRYCPDVRDRALKALDLDNFASGLVGYT
ncbi:hypothetical protein ACFXNW_29135 [Nocardia sp. NPDC059180]|uniref:hypothetical protein n=1 Tax=Nocardia sp. NPDC059180 TaxID=3346761 RepID=UPI0036B7C584